MTRIIIREGVPKKKRWLSRRQGLEKEEKTLAVEAPRFGKGSGAKEDPLQPADSYIL
jgi:hypothetical protein